MTDAVWFCSDKRDFLEFCDWMCGHWDEKKPLTISWKIGFGRSIGQNNLFHRWVRRITAQINKNGTAGIHNEATVKTYLKRKYGIIEQAIDPVSGEEYPYLVSTSDYTVSDMYHFMNAVFEFGVSIGCTLEVVGEYEQLKNSEVS